MLSPAAIAAKYGVAYVSDWAGRLTGRLYTQFRGSVSWAGFVTLLARQFQDLEDSAMGFYTLMSIDDSEGVQLDRIGRLVGQERNVADDATYRLLLKARVLANRSEGTPEQLYKVFNALLGAAGFLYIPGRVKQFVLRVNTAITAAQAALAVSFLIDSKEASARGVLEWQQAADASMFCFSGGSGLGFDDGSGIVGGQLAGSLARLPGAQ